MKTNIRHTLCIPLFFLILVMTAVVQAEQDIAADEMVESSLSGKISQLKEQVLELNRDLFILEEELLFPVNTQLKVFVSLDADKLFVLDAVQLKLDDKIVSNYLYTDRELSALQRGGVQQLYIGNLTAGEHELTAFYTGKGPSGRDYKRATSTSIEKTDEALFVELKITGDVTKEQPDFSVRVWE